MVGKEMKLTDQTQTTRFLSEDELRLVSGGTDWILEDSNTIKGSGGVVEYNNTESASRSVGGVILECNKPAPSEENPLIHPDVVPKL